ncbi:TPA: AAA family ATPase, partial [Candidatus Bathyarchaeota archaeon]|nr:AAA family ATPase [Candidatus Bathyarchaeota archaeon]
MKPNPTVKKLLDEVSKHIIGKKEILKMLLVSLLSEGHSLLEGPPGTGKTLIAKSFAQAIGGTFRRIQMTPDMLPADIVGTVFYDMPKGGWRLKQGPIFANVVLIDELNRAPSKTQAALLEAMQERQVTIEGQTLPLPSPFLVLATQLPYGGEGTYPLTEVQIDRIAYQIQVDYPTTSEEAEIISRIDELEKPQVKPIATPEKISEIIGEVEKVHVSEPVKSYIVNLVNGFRRAEEMRSG